MSELSTDDFCVEIIRELGAQTQLFPEAAMYEALDRWSDVSQEFVTLLQRYLDSGATSPEMERALFFIIHLFGEKRESRAFEAICRLLLDSELAEKILRSSMIETLTGILVSTYDGNFSLLKEIIESSSASESARTESLMAVAYLTSAGAIEFETTREYLREICSSLLQKAPFEVSVAWTLAVAFLGFQDLAVSAEAFYSKSTTPYGARGLGFFHKDLERALGDPSRTICFEEERIGPISGVVSRLSRWFSC